MKGMSLRSTNAQMPNKRPNIDYLPESLRNVRHRRELTVADYSAENPGNSRREFPGNAPHRAALRISHARMARDPFAARAAFCSPDTHVALRLRQTYRAAATLACRFSPRVAPRLSPRDLAAA